ncbi:hemoglobin [Prosthecobacter fusiformis]|uniref:Hemoglobin n=1 Tax=Prosthecobacter fusiformis TaxID=48464 RepID=A0A4R7RZ86_9BACT|nr:globin [Prosthecobacter fusiformis]TDU71274.1 hemoglobin [Prosthecobacter fusiformis]
MDSVGNLYHEVGEERLRKLVTAFYARVRGDDLIGAMYPPGDWEGAEKRLSDFLIYRFGGPQTYIQERGHPRLRGRHMPFAIGVAERDRWLDLMGAAMREVEFPVEHVPAIGAFFAQTADFMRNREEPA